MTGLILKDILVMRKALKSYALFLLLYLSLALVGMLELYFVTAMINVMLMMLPLSTFSYDEYTKWDRYAAALPLGRRAMVGARYLFALIIAFVSCAFGLFICVLMSIISGGHDVMEGLATVLSSVGAGLFIIDVMLPLAYKFGPERSRPYLSGTVFLPIVVLFGAYKLGFLDGVDLSWLNALPTPSQLGLFALVPLAALAGLWISFLISCRIMEKKEF